MHITNARMWAVAAALLPPVIASYTTYGGGVLLQIILAVTACVLCEWICLTATKKPVRESLTDGSAVVAGIIIGLSLPPLAAWYVAIAAAVFAMAAGKHAYGGLGNNPFNPAMAGYALAFVSFPAEFAAANYQTAHFISPHDAWSIIFGSATPDAISAPTPLLATRLDLEVEPSLSMHLISLFCIVGGSLLLLLRIADWRLPLSFILGAWLFASGDENILAILSGGSLMLAAFFIITDPVTAANSRGGRWIYGIAAGALVSLLRQHGIHADGIAFAILICNMLSPLADKTAAALAMLPVWMARRWK